jgi:hypothetical protein
MVRRECGGLENMDTQANNGGAQRRLHPEERAKAETEAAGPRMKSESLLDKIKRINAKGKDATADDLAEVFGAIMKEGSTERVNRKTKELTPERNARIDKMYKALRLTIGEQMLDHGPDRCAEALLATSLCLLIRHIDHSVHSGFVRHMRKQLTFAEALTPQKSDLESLLSGILGEDVVGVEIIAVDEDGGPTRN